VTNYQNLIDLIESELNFDFFNIIEQLLTILMH